MEITIASKDHENDNIADETHNYSYCSDEYSTSSPMPITPKLSTRTLIDFWSSPHESGMTMSFSQYDKNSTGDKSSAGSSSNNSSPMSSESGNSMNYSPDTSLGTPPTGVMLDVTCDDEKHNDVHLSTADIPEDNANLSHRSAVINDDTEAGIIVTKMESSSTELPRQDAAPTAPIETIDSDSVGEHIKISNYPVDSKCNDDNVEMKQKSTDACQGDGDMPTSVSPPISQVKQSNDVPPTSENESSRTADIVAPLPPLPPPARRPKRRGPAITREQYIAKAVKKRSAAAAPLPVFPSADVSLSTAHPTTAVSLSTTQETPTAVVSSTSIDMTLSRLHPENLQSTPAPTSISFPDTSLSTIHGDAERSFDREMENDVSHGDDGLTTTAAKHPFSPEREVTVPDDDDLDLTSIHSEDSDGEIPRNTRHHIIDIVDSHHSLIQDVYIPFPQAIANLDDDDDKQLDDSVHTTDAQQRNACVKNYGTGSLPHDFNTETPVSVKISIETEDGSSMARDLDGGDGAGFQQDTNVGSSREHNRSNDTENMLANVLDAAEKSILKSQEERIFVPAHPQDPSMFFDCEEYDASSQILPNESTPPLQFMTLNDPMSPLATINDCEIYENTKLKNYGTHVTTSPVSIPSEHLFTRITPLRSNSSRFEDVSRISSATETITLPPLKKKVSKKKSLPRIVPSSSQRDTTSKIQRTKHEYRKREKRSSPEKVVEDVPVDDDELSSSVSTMDMDYEKDESTDNFWIDAFLDFVSPPEDSRSVDSDSSTSTCTGSNGAAMMRNVDASTGNTISTRMEHGSSQKQYLHRKKPPTSLSRLRDWWQKELIEEVMKGNIGKSSLDIETDSVDLRGSNDTVEKLVSKEFHRVLHGQKVSLLGSKKSSKKRGKTKKNANWLESLKATIESATATSIVCGATESTIADDEPQAYDGIFAASVKSFDSLDDLVRELKNTKIETNPTMLRGHFQSMYDQLQQKLKEAHLFDQAVHEEATPFSVNPDMQKYATTKSCEKDSIEGPCVEVLPDDSLQFLLHSASSLYSPPTSDYVQQSTSKDIPSPPRSGKSKTKVAKALAQAKAAIAQRRRKASILNSEAGAVLDDVGVYKAENETSEVLKTIKEDTETSVALEDLDISMDDCTDLAGSRVLDAEDDVRVTFSDLHSNVSDSNETDSSDIDFSFSELDVSGRSDNNRTCTDSNNNEGKLDGSIASNDGNEYTPDCLKDSVDKCNVTKETVTDSSGTDDSINITRKLDQLIVSRIEANVDVDESSLWHNMQPQLDTSAASGATANESHGAITGEYHPLDSSGDRRWHELSTSGPSDDSIDPLSSVYARTPSLSIRSRGSRSSNLKTISTLTTEDASPQKHRMGFKSKAFRKAESYVAMQSLDINSSLSTSRSSATSNSESAVTHEKPCIPKEVRSTSSSANTIASKLTRNASILSIIGKKSRRERHRDKDVLKVTLFNSTERGSDDDTSPHGNDFDWEEFPSNPFYASNGRKIATTAEI